MPESNIPAACHPEEPKRSIAGSRCLLVLLVGSLAVVPEPSHYAVLMGACILLLVGGRRWMNVFPLRRYFDNGAFFIA